MSLAKISHRLAAARQNAATTSNRKEDAILDLPALHISLSAQWQSAASISEQNAKPMPLEAVGSLLFSLSGYTISTTKEYFNGSNLDKCAQVMLVVIENMSTLDLEEKPSLLGKFRDSAMRNGLTALVMPALAADHSTGSDLSQVRVNFDKDTPIIKHLLSETSGVRKLKTINGKQPKVSLQSAADEIEIENSDSGTESSEEDALKETGAGITQRIKDFQLKFPRRFESKLKERLRKADPDAEDEPARKQFKKDGEQENKKSKPLLSDGLISDPADSIAPEKAKKLRELKRALLEIQQKIKKLRGKKQKDEEHQRKTRQKALSLRREFRSKKQEYEIERVKNLQGDARKEDVAKHQSSENSSNAHNGTDSKSEGGLNLTPCGTVINAGNLDRSKQEKFDRTLLLLSPSEMKAQGFILNYKPSRSFYAPVHSKSKLFGVDCEMCLTTNMTNELTRVTVVDEDGVVLMDSLVKPRARIINYLTQFSGITPEMMQGVTTRKETVLKQLEEILPPDGILVGHSLESDLKALEISHPYCIDTSVCYSIKGSRQKSKLKVLMKTFLGEDIQTAGAAGHCSAEDSYSALKLVLLKLQNDISFGDIDLKGNLEWNGVNYEDALKEALRVVAKERSEQGPYRNVWVRRNPRRYLSSTRTKTNSAASPEKLSLIAKLESRRNEDEEYCLKKRKLSKIIKERRRQERVMSEIKDAFKADNYSNETIARKIVSEANLRRKHERRARENKSQVDQILLEKLHAVEARKKELLNPNDRSSSGISSSPSLVVLLAKRRFIEQKLSDIEKKADRRVDAAREKLLSELAKLQEQIRIKEQEEVEQPKTRSSNVDQSDADDDEESGETSSDESKEIAPETDVPALTEADVLQTLAENESALEQLRFEEEILNDELTKAAVNLRRATMEARVAAKHEHNEILARKIVNGLVDVASVFEDEELLHKFIEYQLFVLRKNEEFIRKRGKTFGTVALERLYLNMFTAWRSAGKKSVVVADKEVAEMNYDRVEIKVPEDGSLSSTVNAARKCLRTHDLVVSHLGYDDVNENEASIERALDLLWERIKPAGVMIVLLEGTYHYKKLGHALAIVSIKSR